MGQKPSTASANFMSVTSGSSGTSSLSRNSANDSTNGTAKTTSSRFMMLNWTTLLGNGLIGKMPTAVTAQHNRPEQPIKFQYSNRKGTQKKQANNVENGSKIINTENSAVAVNNNINNNNNSTLKSTSLNKKDRHNRHRRKLRSREKEKIEREHQQRVPPQFGYEIQDIDEFLTKATLDKPANIPVVLAFPSVLYQTRIGGYQAEIALPLGMVVNAVFKNQHWLYVQTPHAEEGYVSYAACLPLGIIPAATLDNMSSSSSGGSPPHCWEHCSDVFPKPSGNQTDTEKISSYSNNSTSSKSSSVIMDDDCCNDDDDGGDDNGAEETKSESVQVMSRRRRRSRGGSKQHGHNRRQAVSICGERSVDRLYLRATANNKRLLQLRQINNNSLDNSKLNNLQVATTNADDITTSKNGGTTLDTLLIVRCDYQPSLEEHAGVTAMANVLTVSRGEVVSLLAVARQPSGWFWVRTRGGAEGFIPATIVGHGFL